MMSSSMSSSVSQHQPEINSAPSIAAQMPLHLWLTLPVAIGTFIVALVGVLNPSIYNNSESFAAQGQAQDLMLLLLALPTLLISTWYTARGSIKGKIVWLGTMIYLA